MTTNSFLRKGAEGQVLISALCDSTGLNGTAWCCIRGGSVWGLGKGSSPQGGGHGTGCAQGSNHGTGLPEFTKCLDNTVKYIL